MASKFTTSAIQPMAHLLSHNKHHRSSPSLNSNSSTYPHHHQHHHHHHHLRLTVGVAASASPSSQGSSNGFNANTDNEDSSTSSESFVSTRAQLDLLEQLTSSTSTSNPVNSSKTSSGISIRDQLQRLVPGRDDDFNVPLGKNLKKFTPKFLSTSQKRNIKRQTYLNEVSKRNDFVFFATVGAFVLVPPLLILGIAVLTGYVQLFP